MQTDGTAVSVLLEYTCDQKRSEESKTEKGLHLREVHVRGIYKPKILIITVINGKVQ